MKIRLEKKEKLDWQMERFMEKNHFPLMLKESHVAEYLGVTLEEALLYEN